MLFIIFSPRGAGIRRAILLSTLSDCAQEVMSANTISQQKSLLLRHKVALYKNLSSFEMVIQEIDNSTRQTHKNIDRTQSVVSLTFNLPSRVRGRQRSEIREAVKSISAISALAELAPEALLRYAEYRGLIEDLGIALSHIELTSESQLLSELVLTTNTLNSDREQPSGKSANMFEVLRLAGCELPLNCNSVGTASVSPYATLDHVSIVSGFILLQGKTFLVTDDYADPRRRGVAGQHPFATCGSRRSHSVLLNKYSENPDREYLPAGLLLSYRTDANWFHFVVDTLPRLRFFAESDNEIPLLVNSTIPKTGYDLLKRLTSRRIILMKPDTTYEVSRLSVIVGRTSLPDTIDRGDPRIPEFDSTGICWLQAQVQNLWESRPMSGSVLMVERNSGIRKMHGRFLFKLIPSFSKVERLDPEQSDLDSQITAYRNCQVMIVPGGAGMTNLIFTNPETKTIGLVTKSVPTRPLWEPLAAAANRSYLEISMPVAPTRKNTAPRHHRDVVVTPRVVMKLFRLLDTKSEFANHETVGEILEY